MLQSNLVQSDRTGLPFDGRSQPDQMEGGIGFGLAAVVAPVLLLVSNRFLPGPVLVTSMLLTLLIAWRDRQHAVWPEGERTGGANTF